MSVYGLSHVNFYVRFRPYNHKELLDKVLDYLNASIINSKWERAVDVGCGPGQCVALMAANFKHVFGCDISKDQIQKAKQNVHLNNVVFTIIAEVGPAEALPVPDESTDLVTCSQSIHWFDLDRFYPEVNRILKPNGVLAAFGYNNTPSVEFDGDVDKSAKLSYLIANTYNHPYLRAHWIPKLKAVDRCYRDLYFPFGDTVHTEDLTSSVDLVASELIGYIQTWSDFHRCRDENTNKSIEVLNYFNRSVDSILNECGSTNEIKLKLHFKHFLLMGRKV